MFGKYVILGLCLTGTVVLAQQGTRVDLGRLQNGATVSFVRAGSGDWGIEISGGAALHLMQQKPAQIEVFRGGENISQLAAGYQTVQKENDAVVAMAKVAGIGKAAFTIEDRWKISGAVLLLSRKVSVNGADPNAGFYSAVRLVTASTVKWEDVNCLILGLLYAEPHGRLNYRTKRFTIREDYMSAPLLALRLRDGNWAAVLNPAPRGDTNDWLKEIKVCCGSTATVVLRVFRFKMVSERGGERPRKIRTEP